MLSIPEFDPSEHCPADYLSAVFHTAGERMLENVETPTLDAVIDVTDLMGMAIPAMAEFSKYMAAMSEWASDKADSLMVVE